MLNKGLMTSNKQDYETDEKLIKIIKECFEIDLDLCANRNNVCNNYYTKEQNCFNQDISNYKMIYCNPPYNNQKQFIEFLEKNNSNYIALLPARTDTKLFHNILKYNLIIFIKGRLKFNTKQSAPFPSMLIIRFNDYNFTEENMGKYLKLKQRLQENNYL